MGMAVSKKIGVIMKNKLVAVNAQYSIKQAQISEALQILNKLGEEGRLDSAVAREVIFSYGRLFPKAVELNLPIDLTSLTILYTHPKISGFVDLQAKILNIIRRTLVKAAEKGKKMDIVLILSEFDSPMRAIKYAAIQSLGKILAAWIKADLLKISLNEGNPYLVMLEQEVAHPTGYTEAAMKALRDVYIAMVKKKLITAETLENTQMYCDYNGRKVIQHELAQIYVEQVKNQVLSETSLEEALGDGELGEIVLEALAQIKATSILNGAINLSEVEKSTMSLREAPLWAKQKLIVRIVAHLGSADNEL